MLLASTRSFRETYWQFTPVWRKASVMNKVLSVATAAALFILPLASSHAATIDPTDFDLIITEGKRVQTLDGADVSNLAWNSRNSDVKSLDIGPLNAGDDVLLVGGVGAGGADVYFTTSVTGIVEVSIVNFAQSPLDFDENAAFGGQFDLSTGTNGSSKPTLVSRLDLFGTGDELVENQSLAPVFSAGQQVWLSILGLAANTDFDIRISVGSFSAPALSSVSAPALSSVVVPLPAGLPLMTGAFAMLGMVGLRRSKNRRG